MIGPSKYNDECTKLRTSTNADAAIAIVINGNKGSGFACQAPEELTFKLPSILRMVADGIESGKGEWA